MPYLFKLSQRVARSRTRALLVGAAAFFAACETGDLSSVNAPTHPSFATTTGAPAQVTDLAAAAMTDTSATLRFTEVDDGLGAPSPRVTRGRCATPVTGTAIGAVRSCTVLGLTASATYSFELVAFRGTLKVNAVFGNLSDVASGATAAAASVPVASVVVTPGSATLNIAGTQQLAVVLKDAAGNTLTGRTVSWTSSNSGVATVSAAGLATAVTSGSATITATSEGKGGTAAIAIPAPVVTSPGTVSDLKVASTSDTSVTLSFTEVTDGSGQPASYDIRGVAGSTLTWGSSAPSVTRGTCTTPVIGTAIGAKRTCAVLGMTPGTTYSFELVAYRGTLKVNAVFGNLSNVVSGTTAAVPTVPAPVAT